MTNEPGVFVKLFLGLSLLVMTLSACSPSKEIKEDPNVRDILNCHDENNSYSIVKGSSVTAQDPDSKRAILLIIRKGDSDFVCTGSAISDRVILTAAHCVKGAGKGDVTAIFHPEMACDSGYDRTRMTISSEDMTIHEKYDGGTKAKNDLALIKLSSPIPASYPIATIYDGTTPLSSDQVLMIGYGVTNEQGGDSMKLRKTIKSYKEDSAVLDHRIGFLQNNSTGGVCSGDSGGPVYVMVQGQYKIIGVNSVVTGKSEYTACHEMSMAMYAPFYAPWIQENLLKLQ